VRIAFIESVHEFPQVSQLPDVRSLRALRGNATGL
jgi:hypothetical protein